jgi:hypothetical protein
MIKLIEYFIHYLYQNHSNMTEKLPITTWTNKNSYIYYLFDADLITIADILGLHEDDEPFLFNDYQWYLVPATYIDLMPRLDETIFGENYLLVKYRTIYWIAERLNSV